MESFEKKAGGSKKSLEGTIAAVGVAAAIAMSPVGAEARVTGVENAGNNQTISEKQKELDGKGIHVIIEHSHSFGNPLVLKTPNGKVILSIPTGSKNAENADADMARLLALMTPKRVAFETEAMEAERTGTVEPIRETVDGTQVKITPYAQSLMRYMGIRYQSGTLVLDTGKVNLVKGGGVHNEEVGISGVQLEEKLIACVETQDAGGKGAQQLVYFITKDGTKQALSQGTYKEVREYCR